MGGRWRRCTAPASATILSRRPRGELRCPVLANGNVHGPEQALALLAETGARGLMIGRGAIRNPWLFDQIRQRQRGEPVDLPTGGKCWPTSTNYGRRK